MDAAVLSEFHFCSHNSAKPSFSRSLSSFMVTSSSSEPESNGAGFWSECVGKLYGVTILRPAVPPHDEEKEGR